MDPFESFKKWKSLEIDPLNPKVNKKRTNKQEKKNTEKSKIISRLKYKSKYLEIELEFIDEKLEIQDLVFKGADFKIQKEDLLFFYDLLKTEPNPNNIIFKEN